jgi:hypothetical protein
MTHAAPRQQQETPALTRDGLPLVTRAMPLAPSSYDAATREFDCVLATSAPVSRRDWRTGAEYDEILDPAGADLSRADASGVVLLDSHSSWGVRSALGRVLQGTVRVDGEAIVGRARLTSADDALPARQRFEDGTIREMSVGYTVDQSRTEIVPADPKTGKREQRIARSWQLYEASLVLIPADASAGARSAAGPESATGAVESQMTVQTSPVIDLDAERAAAAAAERQRSTTILTLGRTHGVDVQAHVDDGSTVEAARAAVLEALAARSKATQVDGSHRGSSYGTSQDDHLRAGLEQAIERKIGIAGPVDVGRRYMGRPALEMVRQHLVDSNVPGAADLSRDDVWRSALGMGLSFRQHTTSDFPQLLASALNKSLLSAYGLAPTTWERWARPKTYRDFRAHPSVRMGVAPSLLVLPEGGTIEYGTFGDSSESTTAVRYARGLAVSEQTLINDELQGVAQAIASWGQVVRRKTEALVVSVLETNAALSDSVALFHSDHANIVAAATPPSSLANIDAAVQILDAQTNGNERLMLEPRYLLVPTARDLAARQTLGLLPGVQTSAGNLIPAGSALGFLEVVKVPGLAATYWYLAADPSIAPVVEAGYLEGRNGPRLESMIDFDSKGIKYTMDLDFGCGAIDYRGMVRVANT